MRTMSKIMLLAGIATGAGLSAARRISASHSGTSRSGSRHDNTDRWLAVTVYRPAEEVDGNLPRPLAELGDRIEVRITPASADRGTVLAARLRESGPSGPLARLAGRDPRQQVRSALRQAKSLLETGDVLVADPPTAHPGPGGRLIRLLSRRAGGEGRL